MSGNVKVYGSFRFAESVTFDAGRNLLVVMNAGVAQDLQKNDGYVSLLHPDGSVHTAKWIGAARAGLTLNQPLGSALHGGNCMRRTSTSSALLTSPPENPVPRMKCRERHS